MPFTLPKRWIWITKTRTLLLPNWCWLLSQVTVNFSGNLEACECKSCSYSQADRRAGDETKEKRLQEMEAQ